MTMKVRVIDPEGITPQDFRNAPITTIDPHRCPHVIFAAKHYRPDGSCKCNDQNETIMAEWGYVWKDGGWQSPEDV